jgi:DNA-directed RNA polymerase subunit delta
MNPKKRIVKDYENLPEEIINRIKMQYPHGFAQHLISYLNKEGKKVSALPFETEEVYYLVRMTVQEARQIIADDEDYDDDGNLREDFGDDDAYDDGNQDQDYNEPGEEDSHNLD